MKHRKFENPEVEQAFNAYPKRVRDKLLVLRDLIFQIAKESDGVGEIDETLKWGNPSYLTHSPKSGTTIRLSDVRGKKEKYAIFVHCQTSLVSDFRDIYPQLEFGGSRSLIFDIGADLPIGAAKHFLASALMYHHKKTTRRRKR